MKTYRMLIATPNGWRPTTQIWYSRPTSEEIEKHATVATYGDEYHLHPYKIIQETTTTKDIHEGFITEPRKESTP